MIFPERGGSIDRFFFGTASNSLNLVHFLPIRGEGTCPFIQMKNIISVMPAQNIEENPKRMTTENRRSIQFPRPGRLTENGSNQGFYFSIDLSDLRLPKKNCEI